MEQNAIAYFSMEIALEQGMPTYSGGLGVLAGDMVRSAADLRIPMVGVTLLYRKGYFYQHLDATGWQSEEPSQWNPEDFLEELPARVTVEIEGRNVQLRAWRYDVGGISGYKVPVFLLDADLPENTEQDRALTHFLYGGDQRYRLCQEVVLGRGGVRMLHTLGYENIERFHMNEGHAALLTLELLDEEIARAGRTSVTREDMEAVRAKCVFTTHTPVPAGHDQFPLDLVTSVVGPRQDFLDFHDAFTLELMNRVFREHRAFAGMQDLAHSGLTLNMTYMALNCCRYVNGVAKKHGEVAGMMFAGYQIDAITNGVHAGTWTAKPLQDLFDKHIPAWRHDNFSLRSALNIPVLELWQAHLKAKQALVQYANHETNAGLKADVATLGFARRAATYKRADLLFANPERLKSIAEKIGPFQIVYAGKAHPQDVAGKETIQRIFQARDALQDVIRIAYLENYDMALGKLITSGVDVWLNSPQPPLEASGTSGMKAALNGVPSLSILDGWWIEGCIEGVTGWAFGESQGGPTGDNARDAGSLYDKLEHVVLPLYYGQRERYVDIMRHAIALNGSFFNTQRMVQQYVLNAYFR